MINDFSELKIVEDGVGDFHANQFRIHFRIPCLRFNASNRDLVIQAKLDELASNLFESFPRFFNGSEGNLKPNRAEVEWGERWFRNGKTLAFTLDLKFLSSIELPDFHDDWVGVVENQQGKGFGVQTLKREYRDWGDRVLEGLISMIEKGADKLPFWDLKKMAKVEVKLLRSMLELNRMHVLAGRRSWIVGVVDERLPGWKSGNGSDGKRVQKVIQGKSTTLVYDSSPVFYLETAAVERDSSFAAAAIEYDPGIIANTRDDVKFIWKALLWNFVKSSKDYVLDTRGPREWQSDDGDGLWQEDAVEGVWYRAGEFDSVGELRAKAWVNSILKLHPCLGEQLIVSAPGNQRAIR
ncbi:hypothetical protein [Archangium sp.]|uniref:hypothetical protein n=1 Tax=Archangium sp. TaxID=1872627 RepID=UPI00389AE22D